MTNVKKQLVCINCPLGCRLDVQLDGETVLSVKGQACRRGEDYARQEAVQPMRVLTALMRTASDRPFSVKTDAPIPQALLLHCAAQLARLRPSEPIAFGDIVAENICDTGSNVVATSQVGIEMTGVCMCSKIDQFS